MLRAIKGVHERWCSPPPYGLTCGGAGTATGRACGCAGAGKKEIECCGGKPEGRAIDVGSICGAVSDGGGGMAASSCRIVVAL